MKSYKNSLYLAVLFVFGFAATSFAQYDDLYYNPDTDSDYYTTSTSSDNYDEYDEYDEAVFVDLTVLTEGLIFTILVM